MRHAWLALVPLALFTGTGPVAAQCGSVELARLEAWNGSQQHNYGTRVAVWDDTILSSGWPCCSWPGPWDAYVHGRDQGGPGAWGLVHTVIPPPQGQIFTSLCVDGDTAVVGGYLGGDVLWVLDRDTGGPGAWGLVKTIENPTGMAMFGRAAALEGDLLVAGAPMTSSDGGNAIGRAFVYARGPHGPGDWELVKVLGPPVPVNNGQFGGSVAIWEDEIVVGSIGLYELYVFRRDEGGPNEWGLVATVTPSALGPLIPFLAIDRFGDTLAVADPRYNLSEGVVYLFERNLGGPDAWGERTRLQPAVISTLDSYGSDLALEADTLLVGAPGRIVGGIKTGAVFVYGRDEGGPDAWGELEQLVPSGALAGDGFGSSVDLQGGTTVVGAPGTDTALGNSAGAVYVFTDVGLPRATSYCTAGVSASGCQALLSTQGTPSATAANGFLLQASGVEGAKDGLFFFGTSGRQAAPWGSGTSFQCVAPPVSRAGLLVGTGTVGVCDGSFAQDLNARWTAVPGQNPGAGVLVQAQLWYRDPLNTGNQSTSLSDALEFFVCP